MEDTVAQYWMLNAEHSQPLRSSQSEVWQQYRAGVVFQATATVHHTQTVEFFELKFLKNRSVLKETV